MIGCKEEQTELHKLLRANSRNLLLFLEDEELVKLS